MLNNYGAHHVDQLLYLHHQKPENILFYEKIASHDADDVQKSYRNWKIMLY